MDKKQIQEFVESVAEVEYLRPKTDPSIRLDETDINEIVYDGNLIEINKKSNPTLGYKLVKFKDVFRACELGCGDIVSNQRIEYKVQHPEDGCWRIRCVNCSRTVNPEGGFLESHEVGIFFSNYRRRRNK